MKNKVLIKIKWLNRYFHFLLLYFFCYNTYFGWNKSPLTDLERNFDDVLRIGIFLGLGFVIDVILSYIKFKLKE